MMRSLVLHACVLLTIMLAWPSLAEQGVASVPRIAAAKQAVRQALRDADRIVAGEGSRSEKLHGLRGEALRLFDTAAMSRRALGDVLASRPSAQQDEFITLFDEFIVRAYLQKLLFFRNPRFAFARTEVKGDLLEVKTLIRTSKDDYFVDYLMAQDEKGWRAKDVLVEHISLSENLGAQFRSLLRNESFEQLLERMRSKVARQKERAT